MSRHRADHAGPRRLRSSRQRREGLPRRSRRCARWAPRCTSATTPAHVVDADTVVVSSAIRRRQPRAGRGAAARAAGAATAPPRSPSVMAGRAAIAVAGTARQDDDHLDADRRAPGLRRRPVATRSAATSTSPVPTRTTAPASSSSPRPTRATGRSCCSHPRSRSSPTSRPTTSTTTATLDAVDEAFAGVRRRGRRTTASSSSAPTTRVPRVLAAAARPRGLQRRHLRRRPGDADVRASDLALDGLAVRFAPGRATAAGSATSPLRCPAATTPLNAVGALAAGAAASALPVAGMAAASATFTGARRRFELKGEAARRAGLRRLRAPPDRARRRPDGGPRRSPDGGRRRRRLPAAPLQPHQRSSPAVRRGARAGRRGRRHGRLRRARGPGARRHRQPDRRAVPLPRGAGGLRAVAGRPCPASSRRWLVRATWC